MRTSACKKLLVFLINFGAAAAAKSCSIKSGQEAECLETHVLCVKLVTGQHVTSAVANTC